MRDLQRDMARVAIGALVDSPARVGADCKNVHYLTEAERELELKNGVPIGGRGWIECRSEGLMPVLQETGRSQEPIEDAHLLLLRVGRPAIRPMVGPSEPREHRGRCEQDERHRSISGRLEVTNGMQD